MWLATRYKETGLKGKSLDDCAPCNERESQCRTNVIACIIQSKAQLYLNYLDLGVGEMQ